MNTESRFALAATQQREEIETFLTQLNSLPAPSAPISGHLPLLSSSGVDPLGHHFGSRASWSPSLSPPNSSTAREENHHYHTAPTVIMRSSTYLQHHVSLVGEYPRGRREGVQQKSGAGSKPIRNVGFYPSITKAVYHLIQRQPPAMRTGPRGPAEHSQHGPSPSQGDSFEKARASHGAGPPHIAHHRE